jgi:hypothetical protein
VTENANWSKSPSGLIIPKDDKPRGVITQDDIRLFRRASRTAKQQGLDFVLLCAGCHTPLVESKRKTGELQLSCKCKDRVLEGMFYATSK